jgi:ethylmalonyl-CoA mutase
LEQNSTSRRNREPNSDSAPASAQPAIVQRDKPWLIRTYAGHSTAAASNALYRTNLARGQTGLSVAFDLPTQTGYDPDHPLARGEVGKVGVPVAHLGDMLTLFDGIPLDRMNTSMTINATAPWLLALYVAAAERAGVSRASLSGTTQNDVLKEYLSRGTYMFPPLPSMRLTTDVITFAYREIPKWNPTNVCSYHLQEAGATAVQEIAFALANAIAMLDSVRDSGQVPADELAQVVGRISFFCNAGVRFISEMCKMRAFGALWDEITRDRYGVADPKMRRFRYGVQVNSLGLTEAQPENNVYRILLEMLAVVLSKDARARAVQLPAWNEAMGLPRPWDQQWSLRLQQIVAYETDLLEFEDIFAGSPVIEARVADLKAGALAELAKIDAMGGAVAAIESGYMKRELVASHAARIAAIEAGEQVVVGVNRFTEAAESPLAGGRDGGVMTVDDRVEREQVERIRAWRRDRDQGAAEAALASLRAAAAEGRNVMEASIACAHAGITTGEWGAALRDVFGEYRPVTGVETGSTDEATSPEAPASPSFHELRERLAGIAAELGRKPRILVGKPGLDGHSNGAEQIALRARAAGFEVVYRGIRQTPTEIADLARGEDVDLIGLSILSGSHLGLVDDVMAELRARELGHIPVVVGGIIPPDDAERLRVSGIAAVFTPKHFDLTAIFADLAALLEQRAERRNWSEKVSAAE